ncbi:hypothetical protein BHE74_00010295 [Ensete ventricosum]|nr:hypothetical protein BHE74_00010295 [Ensete ventricosum]
MVGIPEPAARYIGSGVTDGSPPPLELRFEGCRSCSSGGEEDTPRRDGRLDPGVSPLAGANGATYKSMSPAQIRIARAPCFTIPPGFNPSALLESPILLVNMKVGDLCTCFISLACFASSCLHVLFKSRVFFDDVVFTDTLSSQRHTSDVGAYDGRNPEDFQFKPQLEHLMITGIIYKGHHDHPKPQSRCRLAAGTMLISHEEEKTDKLSSLMSVEADRYADHPLPSGTTDWGCFRPIAAQNRSVTIDFDHHRPLLGGISRGRRKKREKKKENLEIQHCFPLTIPIRRPRGEETRVRSLGNVVEAL